MPADSAKAKRLDDAILSAVERLTDFGTGGTIQLRGRWFRDVLDNGIHILTDLIPVERLADYRWFDPMDDSLFRGLGIAWGQDRRDICHPVGDNRHYRFVTVNRANLLSVFLPKEIEPQAMVATLQLARAPSVKAGRPPDDDAILKKAGEMKKRGLKGYEIAKNMRHEEGFDNVSTTYVRNLIRGRYPRGRSRKV